MIGAAARSRLLTVSELAARLNQTLDAEYATVWVAGEFRLPPRVSPVTSTSC
jgi:exonuclease VII large subunit